MGNGLQRLWHESVICGNDDDGNICNIRAAGTHCGKGCVTWSVEKCNFMSVALDAVSANMLGDSTGFASGNASFADGIEKRCFAVINMAHERDDRGSRNDFIGFRRLGFFGNLDFLFDLVVPFRGVFLFTFENKSMKFTDLGGYVGLDCLV